MSQTRATSALAAPAAPARDVRTRILDATDHLLSRYGYRKMTIDDLAAEAGIGKGSVYLHFRSKEDVALACLDRMAGGVCDALRAIARDDARPAEERLREMLLTRVLRRFDYAATHTHSLDDIAAVIRSAARARRAAHFEEEASLLAGVLRAADLAPASRALRTARTMVLATNALLPFSLSVQELGSRTAVERQARDIVDLLLAGVVGPAGSSLTRSSRRSSS